jgi:SAM-dependent methyltransferase
MCPLGTARERLDAQIRFFGPHAPKKPRILEIGCATGELAAATRATLPFTRYDAIELSPAREKARAKVDVLYEETLPELLDNGVELGPYDLILMSHVLEHIPDPEAELRSMQRVLSAKGLIFLEVPNGAGHRRLPIDDNASHLHFFSVNSVARLLAKLGLEIIATATDVRLDARYADSLQVMARPFTLPKWPKALLSDHPILAGKGQVVVWGAGSLSHEILANFFDPERIDFFVDRDPAKQGQFCLGRPVKSPSDIKGPRTIIANSIDFGPAIAADIAALYPGVAHGVVQISDLLNQDA